MFACSKRWKTDGCLKIWLKLRQSFKSSADRALFIMKIMPIRFRKQTENTLSSFRKKEVPEIKGFCVLISNRGWEKFASNWKEIGKNYVSIENPDALRSIANWIRFFAYSGRLPFVTEISQNNLAKNWPESLACWFIRHCIWQNMYQNRKMPDKSSRLAAAFVRHLMQFKIRLFFIAIPLWQSSLRQLFQLCPRSLDQCCKQLMRLRNKAQPIPTCCWSETLQKESTRTMLNLLTKSQQISSVLKPPNNYIVILSRFWRN